MNNKMLFISFVTLGFLITSLLLLVWLLQQNKPLHDQLGEAILKADPNYNEIVHLHADQKQTIAFYKTNKSELGVLSLKKNFRRYKVDDYLGKTSIFTDQKLSWHGTEKQIKHPSAVRSG
ncbi:hypothetical protein [Cohnella hashimotonis]|uniref:Uncharacterized protein n=1 Tax=Cohnella hashimotonis TaxID=2826895 RepID=A0ABT6TA21_9BACL|nr:hypothetical protein [Cohnella hashimotonis]MDI4643676.1 hypothetical protein [Cohnella hashimotonis]